MLVVWELRWPQGQAVVLISCLEATQTGDGCVWPLCPQMLVHQGAAGGAGPGSWKARSQGHEEERGLRVELWHGVDPADCGLLWGQACGRGQV